MSLRRGGVGAMVLPRLEFLKRIDRCTYFRCPVVWAIGTGALHGSNRWTVGDMERIVPNFFIVGAPKCGTTALSEYLRTHKNVFMSRPKEPCYFCHDFPLHRTVRDLKRYEELFRYARPWHMAVGEASVWYMFSKVAIEEILAFNPRARIIAMVRNPIEMIHSFHSQALFSLYENEQNFERAWKKQEERRRNISVPKTCKEPAFLQYADVGSLGSQVERLLKQVPREQTKIIVFDDFIKDTAGVYQEVLEFLNLSVDARNDFPNINANKELRNYEVALVFRRLESATGRLKRKLGFNSLGVGKHIVTSVQKMNSRNIPRPDLHHNIKLELAGSFRPDVEKLSRLLERDLTHWLSV